MWSKAEEVGVKIPHFNIIYDANGSTGGDTPADYSSYKTGSIITIADNISFLVKSGYSFCGWNTKPDGTGVTYSIGQYLTAASSDITLYARWTTNPVYTVTFDGNGATGGNAPVYYTNYESGQTAAIPGNKGGLVKPGFSFTGWNTASDGSGTTYTQSQVLTMPAASVTLYAMWTVSATYTVTYNANGADSGSVPVDSTNYIYGQSAYTLANTGNLGRSGYPFGGWNTQPDGSGTDYAPAAPVTMTANIVLYAKWVTYALGDTGPGGGLIFYINPNYVADGWRYLEAAPSDQSSGIQWYNGTSIDVGASATSTGTGKINTSRIISIQGSGSYAARVCDDLSLSGYNDWFMPSKDELNLMYVNLKLQSVGGFFDETYWSSSEYSGSSALGQSFSMGGQSPGGKGVGLRVRAVRAFRSMNPTYIIVYNSNGSTGGTVPSDTYHYEQGQTVTVANNTGSLVKTGCTFLGWNTAADGSGTDYTPGSTFVMGTDNVVLYAKWIATYTVIYNGNGNTSGSVTSSINYIDGDTVTVLDNTGYLLKINVLDTSYKFDGWNTQADGGGTDYMPGATFTITSDITLYAKWTPYSLRDTGPTGGLIFYDKGFYSDGWRYLEAAPSDQSSSQIWSNINSLIGTTNTGIGSGQSNTAAIIGQSGHTDSAAKICDDYVIIVGSITYDDWFLPSKDELNQMYLNLKVYGIGSFFDSTQYFSSCEFGATSDWGQRFSDGVQINSGKSVGARVRAIRVF